MSIIINIINISNVMCVILMAIINTILLIQYNTCDYSVSK